MFVVGYEEHHEVRLYAKLYVVHMGCPGDAWGMPGGCPGDARGMPGDFKTPFSWDVFYQTKIFLRPPMHCKMQCKNSRRLFCL
jgi:hypothetical protein